MNRLLIIAPFLLLSVTLWAGSGQESPVDHMSALNALEENLQEKYLSYMSEVAHGRRARKMEKRRTELLNSINEAIRESEKLRPYKGDASLREAFKEYWVVLLTIFKEDYHKIVDMEEVAERSYDAMEQYLLIQEEAGKKLHEAHAKVSPAYEKFAASHNVKLVEGQSSKLSKRLGQAGQVNSYMNMIFLIFFKSNVQEQSMLEALKKNDINGVEQSKNSLLKFSTEGLDRLDTLDSYKGDGSLITACRKILDFHNDEAENKATYMTDFLMKKDEFDKIRKAFESKPTNNRTQTDIDAFNKSIDGYNRAVNDFNKTSGGLDNTREKVMNNWEVTRKRFMDQHVPYKL
jgi:hypothetical protein